jgi:hypothetical protein
MKCHIERDVPTYVKYVIFQSPTYMKALFVSTSILYTIMFFFKILDYIYKNKFGVLTREIIDSSLLISPLLSWDGILDKKKSHPNVINIIFLLFSQNMKNNPWYKQYIIIFEQSNEFNNMCIYYQTLLMKLYKNITIRIMDLKVCMLLMKHKFFFFFFILIHSFK